MVMHICSQPGCKRLTEEGKCDRHRASKSISRKQKQAIYSSTRWLNLRASFLSDHPICVKCGDLAEVVDHIKPHRGSEELIWDEANLQAMCKRCHNTKTGSGR